MLENDQVHAQRPQPRAHRQGRCRDARRPGGGMLFPAGAPDPVQVVLDPLRRRRRDLLLLERPGHAHVSRVFQGSAARAGAFRVMVLGPVRDFPAHRRTGTTWLPAPLPLLRRVPLRGPPLLARQPLPRPIIRARRQGRVPAVPRPGPLRRLQPFPQLSDHRLQRGNPFRLLIEPPRLLPDQRITRILRQRLLGHSTPSFPNQRTAGAPTRCPPQNRDQRTASPTTAEKRGA
jgi:hypothetical protein